MSRKIYILPIPGGISKKRGKGETNRPPNRADESQGLNRKKAITPAIVKIYPKPTTGNHSAECITKAKNISSTLGTNQYSAVKSILFFKKLPSPAAINTVYYSRILLFLSFILQIRKVILRNIIKTIICGAGGAAFLHGLPLGTGDQHLPGL